MSYNEDSKQGHENSGPYTILSVWRKFRIHYLIVCCWENWCTL